MAANQVSLFFYPPCWKEQRTPDPKALSADGTPLQLVNSVPNEVAGAFPLSATALKQWLAAVGFTVANWGDGAIFERGQVLSIFGPEKEIQISLDEENGEITGLFCRFTLPRKSPPPLDDWTNLAIGLCNQFHLRLGEAGVAPCSSSEFQSAVRGNQFYKEFAVAFGWGAGC